MAKQPKEYVKAHLRKNGVDPAGLSEDVIEALNAFSNDELKLVDRLGETLQQASVTPDTKISVVH